MKYVSFTVISLVIFTRVNRCFNCEWRRRFKPLSWWAKSRR